MNQDLAFPLADSCVGPFLKWVGGKKKLAPVVDRYLPVRIGTYFEPFVGGGAVFWHLVMNRRFERAVLNDANRELMDTYLVVRDSPTELIAALQKLQSEYTADPKPTFERWKVQDPYQLDPVPRAARLILLNKSGFNGLYRTNRRGIFNVPWGKREKVTLYNEVAIRACSEVLNKDVTLLSGDFEDACAQAKGSDAVYFDPPYVPVSKTASFTSYTKACFTMEDQLRLVTLMGALVSRGVAVVLSNADTPEVRALYAAWEMHDVQMARAINCVGAKRGPVGELIVVGSSA